MDRAAWQKLAQERIRDAKGLLTLKRWSAAYYLAGYAVECGLKSCIIAYLLRTDAFPGKKYSEQCWTHNLQQLLNLAGLQAQFDTDAAADPDLWNNWKVVKDWSEASRYVRETKTRALELYKAVAHKTHGVFSWIKGRW